MSIGFRGRAFAFTCLGIVGMTMVPAIAFATPFQVTDPTSTSPVTHIAPASTNTSQANPADPWSDTADTHELEHTASEHVTLDPSDPWEATKTILVAPRRKPRKTNPKPTLERDDPWSTATPAASAPTSAPAAAPAPTAQKQQDDEALRQAMKAAMENALRQAIKAAIDADDLERAKQLIEILRANGASPRR